MPIHLSRDRLYKGTRPQDPVTLLMLSRDQAGNLPNSQRSPKKPGGHWQRVALVPRHLPPFRHSQTLGIPVWGWGEASMGESSSLSTLANPGHPPTKLLSTYTHSHIIVSLWSFLHV